MYYTLALDLFALSPLKTHLQLFVSSQMCFAFILQIIPL